MVHYDAKNESADAAMNEERFNQIKMSGEQVDIGDDYFAYATLP